ncbi:nuclear transport factor 2 family protein [Rhizobium sp. Kim5]|uniref:nuclear transport factor 2 family protein n=1 Tax=Rhizobium sp. Kim5 TaxID=2020311 RepID=UPI001FD9CDA5|nr:nuclear transport factor 2 family protein [Rhizobium sp. Kim5]
MRSSTMAPSAKATIAQRRARIAHVEAPAFRHPRRETKGSINVTQSHRRRRRFNIVHPDGRHRPGRKPRREPQDDFRLLRRLCLGRHGQGRILFADDILWHIPGHHPLAGTKRGKQEVAAFFQQLGNGNFRAELIALIADENWVIDMHRGWSNRDGLANVDTIWVLAFKIENGKIKEARNFSFDQAAADSFFWQAYRLKPLPDRLKTE